MARRQGPNDVDLGTSRTDGDEIVLDADHRIRTTADVRHIDDEERLARDVHFRRLGDDGLPSGSDGVLATLLEALEGLLAGFIGSLGDRDGHLDLLLAAVAVAHLLGEASRVRVPIGGGVEVGHRDESRTGRHEREAGGEIRELHGHHDTVDRDRLGDERIDHLRDGRIRALRQRHRSCRHSHEECRQNENHELRHGRDSFPLAFKRVKKSLPPSLIVSRCYESGIHSHLHTQHYSLNK